MAGELLGYSGLVTKARAMRGRLLKREDFERIAEFQTVQETISFLREQESYGRIYGGREEIQHRGQVEELIYHSIWEDYRKLYRFCNESQRRALELYLPQLQFKDMSSEVDVSYFIRTWKKTGDFSDKKMQHILREIFGTQIDWLNIMWIYRARRFFHQKPESVREIIIPVHYKLRREEMEQLLAAEHTQEFQHILGNTVYYRGKDALVRIEDEISYHHVMGKMYRQVCRRYPFSIAPVFCYFYLKDLEISHLTTALEGIRYQLPSKDIRDMILIV